MDITKQLKIKSFLGVPVFLKNGELYGNLCCFHIESYTFTNEDIHMLQTMSSFLTYVIELEHSNTQTILDFDRLYNQSELILSSLSEGVFGLDVNGQMSFCNPSTERIFNCKKELLIGRTPSETFLRTSPDSEVFQTLYDGITRTNQEGHFTRNGNELFPVEFAAKAIYEENRIVGAIVTFTDITNRKKSEENLLRSEKLSLAGQLAAGIAHEIRNPLTSIKGFLQMIEAGFQKDEYIKIMATELDRIELIVSELLLLAKPHDHQFIPAKIEPLINDVISILQPQALLNNIDISLTTEIENLTIDCDSNQIKQVFINLIKNAIDALPTGGKVELTITGDRDHVVIKVKDNGIGIPKEKIRHLGQPFYSIKEKGTGLGLMVSYNIIDDHKGSIAVSSEVGVGTTFDVKLPLYSKTQQ